VIHIDDGGGLPLCGSPPRPPIILNAEDELVEAAMQSDCAACRAERMIAPPTIRNQKGVAVNDGKDVRPQLAYTPEPYPDAEEIFAAAIRRRNGF
jgi:hypothetical protein